MHDHAVRAFLAERIPDWEEALIRREGDSRGGMRFSLALGDARAMLKIDMSARPIGCNDRITESRLQTAAASAGLAPQVLYADDELILTEYLQGEALDAAGLADAALLRRLGTRLKALHELPAPKRRFDALGAAQHYAKGLPRSAMAERCVGIVASLEGYGPDVFSHNDLVAENILRDGELRFIDFEYAAANSALFDVATLVAHHGLSSAGIETLVEARFDDPDVDLRKALSQYIHAYHALHWLWLQSTGETGEALARVAAELDA